MTETNTIYRIDWDSQCSNLIGTIIILINAIQWLYRPSGAPLQFDRVKHSKYFNIHRFYIHICTSCSITIMTWIIPNITLYTIYPILRTYVDGVISTPVTITTAFTLTVVIYFTHIHCTSSTFHRNFRTQLVYIYKVFMQLIAPLPIWPCLYSYTFTPYCRYAKCSV